MLKPLKAAFVVGSLAAIANMQKPYNGDAVMATEEITIAEILQKNGYQNGNQ